MENALYYTFSTIPQVLGAAIALLAVFVLNKISGIQAEIFGIGKTLLLEFDRNNVFAKAVSEKNPNLRNRLEKAILRHDIEDLRTQLQEIISAYESPTLPVSLEFIDSRTEEKKSSITQMKEALIVTIAIILFSILVLPFSVFLGQYGAWCIPIFLVAIIALTANLFQMYRLIMGSLKEAKRS
jgi:hypothetical protein